MAKKDQKTEETQELTLDQARAYRAALHVPKAIELSDEEKREEFRKFWAQQKSQYGKSKDQDLEKIIWLHLKAVKNASPEQFEAGIANFGLKKVK